MKIKRSLVSKLFICGCIGWASLAVWISTCDYGNWHMVDVAPCDVQRLYDYLGEWLAARQITGLGDK